MKPEQFIRDFGVKKAREVVDGAPEGATHYELNVDGDFYFKYQSFEWFFLGDGLMVRTYMEDHETCHLMRLDDLKRLVESLDLVKAYGGIESCKQSLYMLHELTEDPEPIREAVRDHESIYGGGQ
ncbi:hypothetical protein [Acinetobacter pittii]|uniref:hypothetical protein n=1 Tax=Acinetobacter pittii TaxID=48296 RepID=UPI00300D321A